MARQRKIHMTKIKPGMIIQYVLDEGDVYMGMPQYTIEVEEVKTVTRYDWIVLRSAAGIDYLAREWMTLIPRSDIDSGKVSILEDEAKIQKVS